MSIEIPLTKGYVTVVDDEDVFLVEYRWHSSVQKRGVYAMRMASRKQKPRKHILLHREIMKHVMGRDLLPKEWIDHIDGNPLNNRRSNLRICDNRLNQANAKHHVDAKSPLKGTCFDKQKGKWKAYSNRKHLGHFDTPEEAHEAYCLAALDEYGEFARFE